MKCVGTGLLLAVRIHRPIQGTWIWSEKIPRAAGSWASMHRSSVSLHILEPVLRERSARTAPRGGTCLPHPEKAHRSSGDLVQPRKETILKIRGTLFSPISHFLGHFLRQPWLQQPSFRYNSAFPDCSGTSREHVGTWQTHLCINPDISRDLILHRTVLDQREESSLSASPHGR